MKCLFKRMLDEDRLPLAITGSAVSRSSIEKTTRTRSRSTATRYTDRLRTRVNRTPPSSGATATGVDRSGSRSTSCCFEAMQRFHHYYGDDFKIECPVGSATETVTISGRRR